MKENVLKVFEDLGFRLEEEEGLGYVFNYEGMDLIYMYNENDDDYLSIALPNVFDVESDKMLDTWTLVNKINVTLKYLKACVLGDRIWLFYEKELFGGEDMEAVIARMVVRLDAGRTAAKKILAEMDNPEASDVSDDDGDLDEVVAEEIEKNNGNSDNE